MNNDHPLKTDVLAELACEPSISANHIGVTATNGIVAFSGNVETYRQKMAAGRVKGVKAVAEVIEVRLPLHIKHGDDETASAALNRMAWDVSVPHDAMKVEVEKGHVTLTGRVGRYCQKDAAAWDIRPLTGVTSVTNQITVKPQPNSLTICDDTRHALHRSWIFDENSMVRATSGKVHLTGNVESWHDREPAAATAGVVPGTTSVSNDILVD